MGDDLIPIKKRLREYLEKRGVSYNKSKKTWRCPKHSDDDPSATLYDNQETPYLYCPVCSKNFSVFDVAGYLDGTNDFAKMVESVKNTLGLATDPERKTPAREKKKSEAVALPLERAKTIYDTDFICKKGIEKKWGTVVKAWKYFDKDNNVIALDVRYEDENKKKDIITWFYDGSLKWFGAPIVIYNLYSALQSEKPLLIVEGAKCVDIAAALSEFTPVSWNGGSGKAHLVDWSVFKDSEIFILPDHDLSMYSEKHENAGELLPWNEQPGMRAALKIKEQLPQSKIVMSPTDGKGDDIEQFLEKMSPEALTAYILNIDNHINDKEESPCGSSPLSFSELALQDSPSYGDSSLPFKILGIGDDGRANFIDHSGRHQCDKLTSINAAFMKVLAPLSYWVTEYGQKRGVDWETASSETVIMSQSKDFDRKIFRGRGAWRDGEMISYHDGKVTYGEKDDTKIYMRLTRQDIGITDPVPDFETIKKTKEIIFKLSFETPADAVRCMGWTVLAPFAGALKFRPAILLTGPTASGKTTVALTIIKPLSACLWLNGSETTVAGIRGMVKRDSYSIVFDETEADSEKKKLNRDDLLSLMRANTSDDTPDTVKGTKEGGYNSYKMQNMFGFIGIDPTIERAADENRIFRINMMPSKKQQDWKTIEKELISLLDELHCRSIRALTWQKLKIIFILADRIVSAIRQKTGRDYRSSYADALLASAFMVVWNYCDDPTDEQISETLDRYYQFQPIESQRDESEEIIDRLLDEVIEVIQDYAREKLSIREVINRLYIGEIPDETGDTVKILNGKEKQLYRQAIGRYGIKLIDKGNVAIANSHHSIKKIINHGDGYQKIFKRHTGWIDGSKNISFPDGKQRRCTIISGIIKKRDEDKTEDEMLMEVL